MSTEDVEALNHRAAKAAICNDFVGYCAEPRTSPSVGFASNSTCLAASQVSLWTGVV